MSSIRKQLCKDETVKIPPKCRERFLDLENPDLGLLADTGVSFAGISILQPGYEIHRYHPAWHALIYTVAGEGWLESEGCTHRMTCNTLWIGPAGLEHYYRISQAPWQIVWLCLKETNRLHFSPKKASLNHSNSPGELSHVMRQLLHESDMPKAESAAMVDAYAHLIYLILKRDILASRLPPVDERHISFEKLEREVRANPGADWSATALRKTTGLMVTDDRFRQLCRAYLGKNPTALVTSIRMERARELLSATDYLVYTIAEMVGYEDEYAFSTAFRRETGASPKQYRLASRQKSVAVTGRTRARRIGLQ